MGFVAKRILEPVIDLEVALRILVAHGFQEFAHLEQLPIRGVRRLHDAADGRLAGIALTSDCQHPR